MLHWSWSYGHSKAVKRERVIFLQKNESLVDQQLMEDLTSKNVWRKEQYKSVNGELEILPDLLLCPDHFLHSQPLSKFTTLT